MRLALGLLLATALPVSAMAALPTIGNPSFETPTVTGYAYNPTGGSWTFTGGAGIAANGSAFGFAAAPSGTQVGFIQSFNGTGSISQALTGFTPLATYDFTFSLAARPGYSFDPITVSFGGVNLGTFTPGGTAFTSFTTATFTPTVANGTLTFSGITTTGNVDADTAIDLVSVIQTAAAPVTSVPEPVSMAILGAGLLGLGLARRRNV